MNSQYPTIGLDVDETLAQLHEPWAEWIRDTLDPTFPGFESWDAPVEHGVPGDWRAFVSPSAYLEGIVEPYPEAYTAVQRLREAGHSISFVTHCINGTADAKLEWLKGYGLFEPEDTFIPTADKTIHEIDLLVDDGPKYVLASPCPAIMVTRPHNRDVPWGWRADDVAQAADMILHEERWHYVW